MVGYLSIDWLGHALFLFIFPCMFLCSLPSLEVQVQRDSSARAVYPRNRLHQAIRKHHRCPLVSMVRIGWAVRMVSTTPTTWKLKHRLHDWCDVFFLYSCIDLAWLRVYFEKRNLFFFQSLPNAFFHNIEVINRLTTDRKARLWQSCDYRRLVWRRQSIYRRDYWRSRLAKWDHGRAVIEQCQCRLVVTWKSHPRRYSNALHSWKVKTGESECFYTHSSCVFFAIIHKLYQNFFNVTLLFAGKWRWKDWKHYRNWHANSPSC